MQRRKTSDSFIPVVLQTFFSALYSAGVRRRAMTSDCLSFAGLVGRAMSNCLQKRIECQGKCKQKRTHVLKSPCASKATRFHLLFFLVQIFFAGVLAVIVSPWAEPRTLFGTRFQPDVPPSQRIARSALALPKA